MKFIYGIIAAMIATSEAYRVGNKKVDARKLMQAAVQVDPKTMRKLQNEDNEDFQLTSAHSIRFNSCTSLTISSPNDEIMFHDDLIQYTKSGQIVAEKSYVLFNICETETCSYYSGDEALYMVDLATYMASMVEYMPQQHQEYCNACGEAQDYCENLSNENQDQADADEAQDGEQANEDQEQQAEEGQQEGEQQAEQEGAEDEQQAEQQDGEQQAEQEEGDQQAEQQEEADGVDDGQQENGQERKLQNNNNNFEVVDCDVCQARNCFASQEQNVEGYVAINEENIAAWADGISQCQQTGSSWDDFALYAGFICNADGSGVEIGIFLDEECSIYTSRKSYKNVVDEDNKELFYSSQEVVTYPFLHSMSCGSQVEYITPEAYSNMQVDENNENNGEDANENNEASEMCRELMNGQAINLYDCNADGQEDAVDNEIEEDQEAGYSWYAYTLASEDAEDGQAVCQILQTMEGEYTVVYNNNEKNGSGSFYDYSSKSGLQKKKGLFITFIVLGIVAIVAGVFVVQGSKANKGKRGDSLLQ